jgi:tetratricopeptide (TPR) repeat protein
MSESDGSDASNDSGSTAESEIFAAVRRARSTLAAGAFTEALALLLYLAAEAPPLGAVLEYEILAALQGATVGRSPRQAAYLYSGVESALPRSASAAVAHGGRLHSDGEHLAALICFERALKIDPTNAPAQEGLENLRSFAAER